MVGHRKRKHASVEDGACKQTIENKVQQGIKAFGSIGKQNGSGDCSKKRKIVHQREPTPPVPLDASAKSDKKRKRALETVDEGEECSKGDLALPTTAKELSYKLVDRSDVATPRNTRFKNIQPPSPMDTPSKSTAALFNKLKLDIGANRIAFKLGANQGAYDTTPDTPEPDNYMSGGLPKELTDVVLLQGSFLSALSMYYAHNGTSSPVDVKALLPMITKHWKKRTVALDDLRILLAMDQGSESTFSLEDFGKGGICLKKSRPRGRAAKRAASYVDEVDLNARFEQALQKRWKSWLAATPRENRDAAVFMNQLPLAEITKSESVDNAAPLFARGQQRLADLKASQASAKPEPVTYTEVAAEHKTNHAVQSRGTSLLDRILAKQTYTASLSAGPTRQQLERKAALHRVEDIARVLDLLTSGRPRCSFSMPTMVQHLQQSLRNPISKEEVERCLGLMAKEITPGFVSLVQSGAVTGVVITKSGKIGLEELRQRVQGAGA